MKVVYIGLLILALVILFTLLGTLVWGKKNHDGTFVVNSNASENNIIYSTDGLSYTGAVDEYGNNVFGDSGIAYDVHWSRGHWVAVGQDESASGKTIAWSDDAKTWTYGTGSNYGTTATSYGRWVEYGDGIWVAGGQSTTAGNSVMKWSTDGKVWNDSLTDAFGDGTTGTCSVLAYLNGLWLAGGNNGSTDEDKIFWSTTGKTWTAATGDPFTGAVGNEPIKFAYGNRRYVAVGNDEAGQGAHIFYSDNGKAWTEANTNVFTDAAANAWDVRFYGGKFVVCGEYQADGALIAYSTDGITWTNATVPGTLTNHVLRHLEPPIDGYWLASGTDGTDGVIYRSTDGITWTNVTPDTFFPGPSGIARGMVIGKYDRMKKYRALVTGTTGTGDDNLYWSDDGTTWNTVDQDLIGDGPTAYGWRCEWAPVPV